jgi:alpha-glucan,water dikinase
MGTFMSSTENIVTRHGDVVAEKKTHDDRLDLTLGFHIDGECLFHWGLSRIPGGSWLQPPEEIRPEKTRSFDSHAVQTPISPGDSIRIGIEGGKYAELPFVLYFPQRNEWDNNQGKNYRISLSDMGPGKKPLREMGDEELQNVASEIIDKETSRNSWTLMHRYNLCYELLDRVGENQEGLALLFVWLRFSALRQLDWQRNYNTKPRELSHAQQRLTSRVAQLYRDQPSQRGLARLMLTTMGHGGEGQRIRDEILEIMHRYGIKEVSDIFMEQWHQKMHNNTTPDDIVICEAYLAFLRSDGDADAFYRTLEQAGVTKSRLESFERPIVARPDFYADKRDAMIGDFEHFLGTLRSVHSATDLGATLQAARDRFDEAMHEAADFVWRHREATGSEATSLLQKVTEFRRRLISRLESGGAVPELLCLDVALEGFFRTVVERSIQMEIGEENLFEWLALAVENFLLVQEEQDLSLSLLQWNHIRESVPIEQELILQAESVLDRIERTLAEYAHRIQLLLQPKAELLGKAFHAEPWTIRLFSEDVMRGGLVFALSVLSHRLRRRIRNKAELPRWQAVSRGGGEGRLEVMDTLDAVQGKRFDPPAILVTERVRGDEDLPEGTVAVLTSGSVDVVSHVAIRARNQGVLLATCYDDETFQKLKSWDGRFMDVEIDESGGVRFESAAERGGREDQGGGKPFRSVVTRFSEPPDAPYVIGAEAFKEGWVGGKSLHLKQLRGKLPGWIHLPASVALPFGTFEKVLGTEENREIRERYDRLSAEVNRDPKRLEELRKTVMDLVEPEGLDVALRERMEKAGLRTGEDTERTWECIKSVWASKWNDRAYYSRKARGIPHQNLLMAVLVQEVVPARYAYILHTVHPFSRNKEEVYAEVVLGLGETLAGNYPGRALSCTWNKKSGDQRLLSFPSKSVGLYGGGLIFRSDSNAEDLAGYAGAGLYSSFPLHTPEEVHLNYTDDPLVQDKTFRKELLSKIGRLGLLVEESMGSPQDIEGAFDGRYHVVQTRPQVGLDERA